MDFIYFYSRQQVSLMRAADAACSASRAAHEGLARLYGSLIDRELAQRHEAAGRHPTGA